MGALAVKRGVLPSSAKTVYNQLLIVCVCCHSNSMMWRCVNCHAVNASKASHDCWYLTVRLAKPCRFEPKGGSKAMLVGMRAPLPNGPARVQMAGKTFLDASVTSVSDRCRPLIIAQGRGLAGDDSMRVPARPDSREVQLEGDDQGACGTLAG